MNIKTLQVDWAEPEQDVDEDVMKQVRWSFIFLCRHDDIMMILFKCCNLFDHFSTESKNSCSLPILYWIGACTIIFKL